MPKCHPVSDWWIGNQQELFYEFEEASEEAMAIAKNKAEILLEDFELERRKRSFIQYETMEVEKATKAEISLKRAKQFNFDLNDLLAGWDKKRTKTKNSNAKE